MSDVTDLTRELVAIPSHEDATAAGDAIEEWMRGETAAEVTRDGAGNVLARRGSGPDALAFVGHHDVVPPADEQVSNGGYIVEARDGRLYGRGTADMKGTLAAQLCAFRDADPACELVFGSFVGEERGGTGARHAIERGFVPEYAVVGEGSTNYSGEGVTDVVVAHKGRRGSTITACGVAAHASEPDAGENAIYRACEAVDVVRWLDAPAVEAFDTRLSGTIVVTEIEGGSAMNTVPERCTITVDERTVPGERAPIERASRIEGVEWTVDQDLPPMRCDDEGFVEAMLDAARSTQSGTPNPVTKPHATDAGWLADAGTTPLIYGAAQPGEAHTATESVSIEALNRCYRGYCAIAESEHWTR